MEVGDDGGVSIGVGTKEWNTYGGPDLPFCLNTYTFGCCSAHEPAKPGACMKTARANEPSQIEVITALPPFSVGTKISLYYDGTTRKLFICAKSPTNYEGRVVINIPHHMHLNNLVAGVSIATYTTVKIIS